MTRHNDVFLRRKFKYLKKSPEYITDSLQTIKFEKGLVIENNNLTQDNKSVHKSTDFFAITSIHKIFLYFIFHTVKNKFKNKFR